MIKTYRRLVCNTAQKPDNRTKQQNQTTESDNRTKQQNQNDRIRATEIRQKESYKKNCEKNHAESFVRPIKPGLKLH